jgi:LPXTG-motif cell wall-anchored protein
MNVAQDTANDLMAYWEIEDDNSTFNAIGAGWSTYNQTTGEVSATEMLQNIDADTMIDGASDPLIEMSWNTDVPGRFVMGQRGGSTVTEQSELGGIGTGEVTEETAEPELAATGAQDVAPLGLGAITLIAGGVVLMVRRRVMSL